MEFVDNIPKANEFPAFLNRNNLFTKILIKLCKFQSAHFSEQNIIIMIKKFGKIPILFAVVGSLNICRLDEGLYFDIAISPQMEKQKLCNFPPESICIVGMARKLSVKLFKKVDERWMIVSHSSRFMIPGNESNLVLFSKDLQGILENCLAINMLIGKGGECEFFMFSTLVFVKISFCVVNTPRNASDHHMFLVFVDRDEDQWGRLLKLEKSNDGNIEGVLIFCRDMGSIHPLKNMTRFKSAVCSLLSSETSLTCICMCLYAYMPFSKYAKESSIDAITMEMANDTNIIGKISNVVESSEANFLSEEYPCIESGRVSTLLTQKRKIGVWLYVSCMKFYFSGVSMGYSLRALDGSYISFV